MATSSQNGSAILGLVSTIKEHPYGSVAVLVFLICLATRIVTGLRFRYGGASHSSISPIPVVPYSTPWLGHTIPFALGFQSYLSRLSRSLGPDGGAFALVIGGSKHNIITSPSLAKQILFGRQSPINMDQLVYYHMNHFWDDHDTVRKMDPTAVWGSIHGVLIGMMREGFVNTAITATVQGVEERIWNLVGGCESWVDQSIWERSGNVSVVSTLSQDRSEKGSHDRFVAEASLHPLLRDFVGDLASMVLMGRDFMENNPNILADLWSTDSKFNMFMIGLPTWFPSMAGPSAARERIVKAMQEHHDALMKFLDGEDPGSRWSDMSDVSSVMVDRVKAWRAAGAPKRAYSTGDCAILWAMNVNANQVIFWLVWYIFSDPSLLQEIRREIRPYVKFREQNGTGLPIRESPKLAVDLPDLWNKCPLLKGAFFETMRLEAASTSYKTIEEDFVVTESEDDARILGKTQPDRYLLPKGELLCIPHGAHQSDDRYWRDPHRFDPRRFWVKDTDEKEAGEIKVDYGTMKVWGGGKQMCKGKTFAEREVVLFVAAIVMCWEIEPVSNGGKWVHPGRIPGAGAVQPKHDVRVRMWRREEW